MYSEKHSVIVDLVSFSPKGNYIAMSSASDVSAACQGLDPLRSRYNDEGWMIRDTTLLQEQAE